MGVARDLQPSSPESLRGFAHRLRAQAIEAQAEAARCHRRSRRLIGNAEDVDRQAAALEASERRRTEFMRAAE
ncbi:hypothetical protein [Stappia indica]|uniref:hypothetical protein n=1 Tax=Stappia indica TaxID=538381 RepID=UPI001CD3D45B|nr:hypothetical protein [Stappia indica]MCA1298004.1 hypothetical protein [Stappia indica]